MRSIVRALACLLCCSMPAFATINPSSPTNGTTVTSPIVVSASVPDCQGQTVTSTGYSVDYGPTTIEPGDNFQTMALIGDGAHTLHFKCWGAQGASDMVTYNLNVVQYSVPRNMNAVPNIQQLTNWVANHDVATGSSSSGTTQIVSSPSLSGAARQYNMSFTSNGGEIFHVSFADDLVATHFIYDAQVYAADFSQVANVEMDLNQVLSDGSTVIYGFQCDGWSGTWDYTENAGTPASPSDRWIHSAVSCPLPATWTSKYHHIQIAYSRDNLGNVTYQNMVFDGVKSELNMTVNSDFALGWGKVLLTNFQLDGKGASGSGQAYVDYLMVYKW